MNTQMVDLTQLIVTVITLVGSVITVFLVPYLRTKMTAEQLKTIKMWVGIAVQAAEMIYKGTGRGAAKKAYVVNFLHEKGFDLDVDEVENLIESAVLELKRATSLEVVPISSNAE